MKFFQNLLGKSQETFDPYAPCDHHWEVVGTVLSEVSLQTHCKRCALYGSVPNPSEEEWDRAFHAPDNPYDWDEPERVQSAYENVGAWMDAAKKPKG